MSRPTRRQHRERLDLPGLTDEEARYLFGVAKKYLARCKLSRGVWDSDDVLQSAYAGVLVARETYARKGTGNYTNYLYSCIRRELSALAWSHRAIAATGGTIDGRHSVHLYPMTGDDASKVLDRPPPDTRPAERLADICRFLPEAGRERIGNRYGVLGYPRLFWGAGRDKASRSIANSAHYWMGRLRRAVIG